MFPTGQSHAHDQQHRENPDGYRRDLHPAGHAGRNSLSVSVLVGSRMGSSHVVCFIDEACLSIHDASVKSYCRFTDHRVQ